MNVAETAENISFETTERDTSVPDWAQTATIKTITLPTHIVVHVRIGKKQKQKKRNNATTRNDYTGRERP